MIYVKTFMAYDNRLPDGYIHVDEFTFNEILYEYKKQGFELKYYVNEDFYDIYAENGENEFLIGCTNVRRFIGIFDMKRMVK